MINTRDVLWTGSAGKAKGGSGSDTAEPGVFARELNSRFKDLKTRAEKIQASLSALNEYFPKANIKVDESKTDESKADAATGSKQYTTVSSDNEVTVSGDVLENMIGDTSLAEQIQKLLEGFLGDGWQKNLIDSREFEGQVWKSMNIQAEFVGYYESYQTQDGKTTVAVANLKMEFDYRVAQNLNMLLGIESGSSSSSSQSSQATQSGQGGNRILELLNALNGQASGAGISGSWSFSGFFSLSASQSFSSSSTSSLQNAGFTNTTTITAILEMQMQLEVQSNPLSSIFGMLGLVDPLVFDLADEGINLRAAEDGVYFDMHGSGQATKTAFIQGNNAFLYMDNNGNGVADDINELFGDTEGYANGFEKLRQFDSNGDGVIDEKDEAYADLRLWRDLNGDGINQEGESLTLADAGIASIDLNYILGSRRDGKGNVISETSSFTRTDGSKGTVVDVLLRNLG